MTFKQSVKTCFLKAFDYKGRASRSEFWYYLLFFGIVLFVATLVMSITFFVTTYGPSTIVIQWIYRAVLLVVFVPLAAVAIRRLHDIDYTGRWYLIALVALIALTWYGLHSLLIGYLADFLTMVFAVVLAFFCARRGTYGSNRFGDDPLAY